MAAVETQGRGGSDEGIQASTHPTPGQQGSSLPNKHDGRGVQMTMPQLGGCSVAGPVVSSSDEISSSSCSISRATSDPVLVGSSTQDRQPHFPQQGIIDMPARNHAMIASFVARAGANASGDQNGLAPAAQLFARTPSYVQPTQSSLHHAPVDSNNTDPSSANHSRTRNSGGGGGGDVKDVSSGASSHSPLQNHPLKTRTLKRAPSTNDDSQRGDLSLAATEAMTNPRGLPGELAGHGSIAEASSDVSASRNLFHRTGTTEDGDHCSIDAAASRASTQCNGFTQKTAGLLQSGTSSPLRSGDNGGPSLEHRVGGGEERRGSDAAAALSVSLATITVSDDDDDDDTTELITSSFSVSHSTMNFENHTRRKSLQAEQRCRNKGRRRSSDASADRGGSENGSPLGFSGEVDAQAQRVPHRTQLMSSNKRVSSSCPGRSSNTLAQGQDRLPPKTPRGDALPNVEPERQRGNGINSNVPVPATINLHRCKKSHGSGDGALQQQQLLSRGSSSTSPVPAQGFEPARGGEETHREGDAPRSDPECHTQRSAACDVAHPQVPRLALDKIHTRREHQHRTAVAPLKVFSPVALGSGRYLEASRTSSSAGVLDVTVSSLTESARLSTRSGCAGHSCILEGPCRVEAVGRMHHQDTAGSGLLDRRLHSSESVCSPNGCGTGVACESMSQSHSCTGVKGSAPDKMADAGQRSREAINGAHGREAAYPLVSSSHTAQSTGSPSGSAARVCIGFNSKTEGLTGVSKTAGGESGTRDIDVGLMPRQRESKKDEAASAAPPAQCANAKRSAKCCLVM